VEHKRIEISPGEIENQKRIIARLRARIEKRERCMRAFVDTYGCQQNEADSEKILGMLFEMGCVFTREKPTRTLSS